MQGPSICENGQCTDLKEGYMCTCNAGYQRKDKNTCIGMFEGHIVQFHVVEFQDFIQEPF